MTKFTKAKLIEIIDAANEVITALADENPDLCKENNDGMIRAWDWLNDVAAPPEVVLEMARQLLAGMEQEPVYQVLGDGSWTDYSKQQLEDLLESKPSTLFRVAYAAPQLPQPAVPDEVIVFLNHLEDVLPDEAFNLIDVKTWNNVSMLSRPEVYRAAMLQGAEPVQVNTLRDGWVAVPVEPTEDMVIAGFEAELREEFRDPEALEAYEKMSGCEQAAHRAKLCWAAMITAVPQQETKI